jgi:hypothetical protein
VAGKEDGAVSTGSSAGGTLGIGTVVGPATGPGAAVGADDGTDVVVAEGRGVADAEEVRVGDGLGRPPSSPDEQPTRRRTTTVVRPMTEEVAAVRCTGAVRGEERGSQGFGCDQCCK